MMAPLPAAVAALVVPLVIASCAKPERSADPSGGEPENAAPILGEGEGEAEGEALASAGAPGSTRPPAAEPTPGSAARDTSDRPAWTACSISRRRAVAEHRSTDDGGVEATVQERLDAGAVGAALSFVDRDAPWVGAWTCRDEGSASAFVARYQSSVFGVELGPEWLVSGPGAVPRAANLLADVVMGAAPPADDGARRALETFQACRTPRGAWATAGLFVWLEMHDPGPRFDAPIGWLAVPVARAGDEITWDVVFYWWQDDRPQNAVCRFARERTAASPATPPRSPPPRSRSGYRCSR